MNCRDVIFTGHAIRRMFKRNISETEVLSVVENGRILVSYPEDRPFPSYLLLGCSGSRPLHVVIGVDAKNEKCYVITVYAPDSILWSDDFRRRRN